MIVYMYSLLHINMIICMSIILSIVRFFSLAFLNSIILYKSVCENVFNALLFR